MSFGRRLVAVATSFSVLASLTGASAAAGVTGGASAAPAAFTDLGLLSTFGGNPIAVSDADTVAFGSGVWRSGTYTPVAHVQGASPSPAAQLTAMNASGLAVGHAGYADGLGSHSVYWDTSGAGSATFYPAFPNLDSSVPGCTHGSDLANTVDAAGEAGGVGGYHDSNCHGLAAGITIAGTASADVLVPQLADIWAIQPGWAIGESPTPGGPLLLNRADGTVTPIVGSQSLGLLSTDGGTIVRDPQARLAFRAASGATTPLALTPGAVSASATGLSDGDVISGAEAAGGLRTHAVVWATPASAPEDLNGRPGIPAGWTLTTASATNARGDVVGLAADGTGGQHAYLLLGTKAITVSMSLTLPPGGMGVGDVLDVPVTVTNSGGLAVTGLSLGVGVTVSGQSAVVTKKPSGTNGFSVGTNSYRTFVYTIKATRVGTVTLDVAVSGAGVNGSDTKTFPVGSRALKMTIATSPAKTALTVDAKGKVVPKSVTVKVTLTNTTKATISGISLLSVHPVPADPTQGLDQLALRKGAVPLSIAPLAGGKSVTKSFPLTVTGDGDYLVRAVALYKDPSQAGGNGRSYAQSGAFTVTVPLLWFRATRQSGPSNVVGGESWYVSGEVRNLSSYQTICLPPLLPKFTRQRRRSRPASDQPR